MSDVANKEMEIEPSMFAGSAADVSDSDQEGLRQKIAAPILGVDVSLWGDVIRSQKQYASQFENRRARGKSALLKLKRLILENEERFFQALEKDLGKSKMEAYASEIAVTLNEIDYLLRHLGRALRDRRVMTKPGSAARVSRRPYGSVLVMSPWNYPFQLALLPVAGALATGNGCFLKPSELAPVTSGLIAELAPKYFSKNEFAVVEGDGATAAALLDQNWDFIFFTGSERIGGIEGFDFNIVVAMGAGAYVCGEETALIESLEGSRGEPRNRPPFPVVSGFLGRPSVVNNVETLAWVPCILSRGVDWFRSLGTENSAGHKLFSVSGDCGRPGIYEFPFGITVAELLRQVGGEGAKAVQIGGASGRCVPSKEFERRLAFEDIPTGGSIIVIGPDRDMLELAHNVMDFFVDESCGNCAPCRLGNRKLLEAVELLRKGRFTTEHLAELQVLSKTMQDAAKCGLGQTSSVAFMSILEHFGEELGVHRD